MPLKRHKNLAPLSRDHMKGLFLARYSRNDAPPYKNYPTDIPSKVRIILEGFENELLPHFSEEEEILMPFIRQCAPELIPMAEEIFAEHTQLAAIAVKLGSSPDDARLLDEFGRLLEAHIRKEERILFEKIQDAVPEETLKRLILGTHDRM